jgi:hypothetical protein
MGTQIAALSAVIKLFNSKDVNPEAYSFALEIMKKIVKSSKNSALLKGQL